MVRWNWRHGLLASVLGIAWLLPTTVQADTARWNVDLGHSTIEFRVAHMVVSRTSGRFMDYSGFVEMDAEAGTVKAIDATIKAASVNTNHEKRDAHLRSPDFFDVEKYPTITYTMKNYTKLDDAYQAVGDLTIHGVTKEVVLTGQFHGAVKDPWGDTRAGFSAEGKVNRKDFGMVWNKTLDTGGLVVGNQVYIKLDIECIKEKK